MNKYFNKIRQSKPIDVFLLGFVILLAINFILMLMPFSTKGSASFIDVLYTAVSITCLGGKCPISADGFTLFGQICITLMSSIIGIFFLTILSYLMLRIFYKKFPFKQSNITDTIEGIKYVFIRVVIFALIVQIVGFFMFLISFASVYTGVELIKNALFFSISAFNSNGILIGDLSIFTSNLMFNFSLFIVQFIGSIGFIVVLDFIQNRNIKNLNAFSKFTLFSLFATMAVSSVLIIVFESFGNSEFSTYPFFSKIINSINLSLSSMSGGFSLVKIESLESASKVLMLVLSLIGAGSVSLSGGIKVTSAAIITACVINLIMGRKDIKIGNKKVNDNAIKLIISVISIYFIFILLSSVVISLFENIAMSKIFFEVCCAISLAGFKTGITIKLGVISKIILMLLMVVGRIGIIYFIFNICDRQKTTIDEEVEEMEVIIG